MPRLTKKRLSEWIDNELLRLEIDYRVTKIETTRFTGDQYENGAAKQVIEIEGKEKDFMPVRFLCFYSLSELQDHLNFGYQLCLKFDRHFVLSNTELDLKKTHIP